MLAEVQRIGAVVCGSSKPEQWGSSKRPVDFYDLKNDIDALMQLRGLDTSCEFRSDAQAWLHPGQSAVIHIDGVAAGWAGAIHPAILSALDIKLPVLAFELDIDVITKRELPNVKNISRFPSVRRDLAFLLPEQVDYQQIRDLVTKIAGELLEDLLIFDVFSGQNVEKGYKSMAIGLILQDVSCTLTDEVVDSLVLKVIQALESGLDAQHRG
jgi:phenylalanyl-tRNA synthetase beta chain